MLERGSRARVQASDHRIGIPSPVFIDTLYLGSYYICSITYYWPANPHHDLGFSIQCFRFSSVEKIDLIMYLRAV